MISTTVLLDVDMGNLRSVERALAAAAPGAHRVVRSAEPAVIAEADRIVFPGQGGFRDCAEALAGGLGDLLVERIASGVPYLGICLGLQILFEGSDEAPDARGLGVLRGRVRRVPAEEGLKVPHMGWNAVDLHGDEPVLTAAGGPGTWYYFVHSYHAVPDDPSCLRATCDYGSARLTAAVRHGSALATQFHPEKSQAAGLALLRAFVLGGAPAVGERREGVDAPAPVGETRAPRP